MRAVAAQQPATDPPGITYHSCAVLPAESDVILTKLLKADGDSSTDWDRQSRRWAHERHRRGHYDHRDPESRLARQERITRLARVTGWPAQERVRLVAQIEQEAVERAAALEAQAKAETAQRALEARQRAVEKAAREAERKVFVPVTPPRGRRPAIPLWVRGPGPPPLLNGPPVPDRLLGFLRQPPDSLDKYQQLETVALLEAVFWARGAGNLRLADGSEQFASWSHERIQLAKYRWLMVNLPHLWARFPPAPDLS